MFLPLTSVNKELLFNTYLFCFKKSRSRLSVHWLLCHFSPHPARCPIPSDLPVCGGHVSGGRWPPSAQGVLADVPEPPPSGRTGGFDHVWEDGTSSRTQLRGDLQELRLPGDEGPHCQADPGQCLACPQAGAGIVLKVSLRIRKKLGAILLLCYEKFVFLVCVGHAGPDQACDACAASAPGSAAGAPVRVQQVSLAPWVGGWCMARGLCILFLKGRKRLSLINI